MQDDGSVNDVIKSFNFDSGWHLANQNQNICIRRESNFCSICFAQVIETGARKIRLVLWDEWGVRNGIRVFLRI